MGKSKMTVSYADAKTELEGLVERFARLTARNRKRYNEPATRQEFVLPLFRALGWNIEDTREVSPEERVSRGFVDFAFRLGSIPRFFLETKKIPADLEDPRWAWQAINYAWLKGVTWAVLTDFEGLKVFNAEWQETNPARAIFKDLYWHEYLDRFDDLWLLSRPAMEEGALDRAAEAVGRKVKKTPVNRQLFADLTEWRRELFRYLRPYNPQWSIEQIDQAVQRILDRLIFIRTCEDREIEPPILRPLLRQWHEQDRKGDLVTELNQLFREFDDTYDTLLFAPHLCEKLKSEPTPFEMVIKGLHEVPGGYGFYDFNAIDADVLGTIYEQYLGHRAQDPEGKQVVDKRAKRKAQGIYYTPQFVVRYIVGQTLGRLLEERDYEQARQVKVLDMACGSGSFLIEAFDVLDRYLAGVRGQNTASAAGDIHDFARRMEILTGNLYGVDLDAQAVEIARLNLLLKAVNQRGELPRLDNIRQGNSLISGTPEELEAAFGPHWRDKHPFNWEEQFPRIMERDGFDVIVGNPPYGMLQPHNTDEKLLAYLNQKFEVASFKIDMFHLFIERGLTVLRDGGYLGLIVPNTFITNIYTQKLRDMIADRCKIVEIVVSSEKMFAEAEVNNAIIILQKESNAAVRQANSVSVVLNADEASLTQTSPLPGHTVRQEDLIFLSSGSWNIKLSGQSVGLLRRLQNNSDLLGDVAKINRGLISGDRDKYFSKTQKGEKWLPIITGTDVNRYYIQTAREFVYFEKPKGAGGSWSPQVHLANKIVIRQIGRYPIAAYDTHPYCVTGNIFTVRPIGDYVPQFLLGILNSRFTRWLWQLLYGDFKAIFPELKGIYLEQFPICRINFDDPEDVEQHDRMVALVGEMLQLQKEHAEAEALKEDRRHDLARRIERLDAEIDALVYELYGLTEEEIGVIEATYGQR